MFRALSCGFAAFVGVLLALFVRWFFSDGLLKIAFRAFCLWILYHMLVRVAQHLLGQV